MFDFLSMKESIKNFSGEVKTLRKDIENKKQEVEAIKIAPMSKDEFIGKLNGMIDSKINKPNSFYPKRIQEGLKALICKPGYDYGSSKLELLKLIPGQDPVNYPEENLFWFFGDIIKARLKDAVDLIEWPDGEIGPPLTERQDIIEKINNEIFALEKKEAELVQTAHGLGVRI